MKLKIATLLLFVAIVCIAILVAYIHFSQGGDGRESFGDKHEWSVLQSIEVGNRGKPISDIEFLDDEEYHIVCIPGVKGQRIWIMLNPGSAPYYKQMPQGDYVLSREQVDRITRSRPTISTVQECLDSHVQSQ